MMRHLFKYRPNFNGIIKFLIVPTFYIITSTNNFGVTTAADAQSVPLSISTYPSTKDEEEDDIPSNAPLKPCGPAGGVKDGQYMEIVKQYMDPLCEDVQGYCRLRKNQNYTAVLRFIPKVRIETLTVKVTSVRPIYGWESSFWPEYSACGRFNITCPQKADETVNANHTGKIADEVPPTRGLYRLRLLGTSSEDDTKRPYICRQIYLQFY